MVEDQILVVEDEYDRNEVTGNGRYKGLVVIHPGSDITGLKCEVLIVSRNIEDNYDDCEWLNNFKKELLVEGGTLAFV